MKSFYLAIGIVLLGLSLSSNAQCVQGIRTNPYDSYNLNFESLYPGKDNPFVNKFDWAKSDGVSFDIIRLNPNAGWDFNYYNMASPFSSYMPLDYAYLWTVNGNIVPIEDLDWHWENGWELMYLNTGYYPDGTEINNPNSTSVLYRPMMPSNRRIPYFILYNRYTGKLRIFSGLFTQFGSVQDVYMSIRYGKSLPLSGIFRNLANYDRPLDYRTEHFGVTTYNKNINNDITWFSSDVQLSYDPCVCQYETSMQFNFDAIKTFDVNLYGREISVNRPLSLAPKDFLNQTSINQNLENGNNLLYKELDKMYSDYEQQLQDYNTKMNDYNSVKNQIKRQVIGMARDGFTNGVASLIPTNEVKSFLIQHNFKVLGKEFPDTNTAEGWAKLAREGVKGLAGEGFDFLSQTLIGSDNKPVAPTMPTATFSEMRISGTIQETNIIHVGNLFTPGSFNAKSLGSLTPGNYPIYNEAVGLFALLERPSIDLYHNLQYEDVKVRNTNYLHSVVKYHDHGEQYMTVDTIQLPGVRNYVAHTSTYLKLNAPLKYRFNHALDFNWPKTKVYASFEVEYYIDSKWIIDSTYWDSFDSMVYTYNSGNLEPLHMYDSLNSGILYRTFNTKWTPVENIGQHVFGIEFTDSLVQRRNPGLDKFYYAISDVKSLWPPRIRKIKMKLMADMYFNQLSYQGDEINTTQVFTYLLFDSEQPNEVTSSLNAMLNKQDIAKYTLGEVVLDSQTVYPNSQYVTNVQGNEIYIDAESIKIVGDIQPAPGLKVFIRALKRIDILPDLNIHSEIVLEQKMDYFDVAKVAEVSDEDLVNFCSGANKKYQAGTALTKHVESINDSTGEENVSPDMNFNMVSVYPNPASDWVDLSMEHPKVGQYQVSIVDAVGVEFLFKNLEVDGHSAYRINTSHLSNGMYILKVTGPSNTIRKQLLIHH